MPQIPDYTQAQTIKTTDLFVIEQQDGTKKATVAQIAEKATEEVNDKIGDLSTLTTSVKSSLVGAVNEVNANKADKAWAYIDKINLNGTCSVSGYSEVLIVLYVNNNRNRESFVYPISELSEDTEMHSIIVNSSANVTNYATATVKVASNTLTYNARTLVGWNNLYLKIYAR